MSNLIQCSSCETVRPFPAAHCAACHATFGGVTAFDMHRTTEMAAGRYSDRRVCLEPGQLVLQDGTPTLMPAKARSGVTAVVWVRSFRLG